MTVRQDGSNPYILDEGLMVSRAVTKSEHAYLRIRDQILRGVLEPGASLDQEALAATLGVSTTPLREALRRLESEQLVINRAHRETIVSPISVEALQEVYVVRVHLEPLGTSIATATATPDELDRIEALVHTSRPDDDPVGQIYESQGIHRAIYRASHNAPLIRILDSLTDVFDRYRVLVFRRGVTNANTAQKVHTEIVDAMRQRNADLASELMREHIAIGFEQMRSAVDQSVG